mgnify:CR=1 FL=1|tara:strand:+ start:198 stop:548 length:351 start_codon:yes stop_codon:yes gene_type:complete
MIPENGFKQQIKIDELPQWAKDLKDGKNGDEIHRTVYQTRSYLEIYKVGEQYIVFTPYAPLRIKEAYIIEVCDEVRKDEHVGFDLRAEHDWERAEDMKADYYEAMMEDREPEDIDW